MNTETQKSESRFSGLAGKAIALVVLVVAGWLLLKFAIGVITSVATIIAIVVALIAVVWALNRL